MSVQLIAEKDKFIIEIPATTKPDDQFLLEMKFQILAKKWEEATKYFSFSRQQTANEYYQQIIAIGKPVVPILLLDLQKTNRHWFFALRSITGEDPVLETHEGNIQLMVNDWITWGKKRKLI